MTYAIFVCNGGWLVRVTVADPSADWRWYGIFASLDDAEIFADTLTSEAETAEQAEFRICVSPI